MNSVQELYFTDKDLGERWTRVKEDFWDDLKVETLGAVKRLLESTMDIEVQDLAGAQRWEHSTKRINYRNGSYHRSLWTAYGWINSMKVPRIRSGGMSFKTFDKYKQRTDEVNSMINDMFLSGVSTRKVKEVLKPLYGQNAISASTVSAITKVLDTAVEKHHRRDIGDDYLYLLLDGIYLNAKSPVRSRRRCILVAYGISADGTGSL